MIPVERDDPRVGRLHVLLDEVRQSRLRHVELARQVAAGGADVIQYREKRPRTTAERIATAREIDRVIREHGARLVINDRADVALACGAFGVHLGRHDLDPGTARRILGEEAVIGATANDLEQALRATRLPIDYLGVGPVFGTASKAEPAPALGLERLARIVEAVTRPVVAIGNITPERVSAVLATGARGVAVLSAVVCSSEPREATARFRQEIDRCVNGTGGRDHGGSDAGAG